MKEIKRTKINKSDFKTIKLDDVIVNAMFDAHIDKNSKVVTSVS